MEKLALLLRDKIVVVALKDEERSTAFVHVVHRAGQAGGFEVSANGAANKAGKSVVGIVVNEGGVSGVAVMQEVGRTVEVDDALNRAGLVEVRAHIESGLVTRRAEEGNEVAARRFARRADMGGIKVVFPGVGAEPADRGFAVLDLRGENGVLAEAVPDAGDRAARSRERDARTRVAIAHRPTAAVDPNEERMGFAVVGRQVEVKLLARGAVLNVGKVAERAGSSGRIGIWRSRRRGNNGDEEQRAEERQPMDGGKHKGKGAGRVPEFRT